ncbi:MFS transporter [Massilia sp. 9096]|uniref:MFS transporter n=1 Tax=Massilia sp. 9096 TaxID=1500894 RepID=UPI0006913F67|nr:MFS transporter [Massilia sp. 9096]
MTIQSPDLPARHASATAAPAHWSAVFAMTLCVFALIASEFMPVSLLTPLAADLHVSEGLAGYGIAISGALAVLTSLSIPALAGTLDRKTLLLGLTALMCFSGLVIGAAHSYAMYLVGRALIGVVVGGFWSMSAAVAMRLVPPASVPKALAIFNGGNALATIVAAPLGSYLGGIIGWRGAFYCLAPVALAALAWQWISMPPLRANVSTTARPTGSGNVLALLRRPVVRLGMLAVGLFFMGQFVLFTYVRPFLETVIGVDLRTLSTILLVLGIAGFVGTVGVGRFLRDGPYRTLTVIPVLMAAIALCLVGFGGQAGVAGGLLALWGLVATAAPVGWWSWLARTLPDDAEAGGGLMVAVVQLSIALGSTLGGVLFDGSGYRATFAASAAILLAAAALTALTAYAARAPAR